MLTSSGQAANYYAVFNICGAGDHVIMSSSVYGGTFNLLTVTMQRMGITCTVIDPDCSEEELNAVFQENTNVFSQKALRIRRLWYWILKICKGCTCTRSSSDRG